MSPQSSETCTAFARQRLIATGLMSEVAGKIKQYSDRHPTETILVFDDATAEQVEFDLRGSVGDVAARVLSSGISPGVTDEPRTRGRPKLGVVAREITLLPRHWQWLAAQPGGASVALRKLVEEARRVNAGKDRIRRGQEVAYRFMSAMAGNLAGFEEATRVLFARDRGRFDELIESWPRDIRNHVGKLAAAAF
jgi:hypothetical protein